MAVPTLQATQTSTTTTAGTSHTVTLPTGVAAGDLLVVAAAFSSNGTITLPSGWTSVHQVNTTFTTIVFSKQSAAGGETTLALTSSNNARMAARAWRISGAHQASPPTAAAGANTTSTTPDPPSLTELTSDHLWIAIAGINGLTTTSAYPSGYGNSNNTQATTSPTLASASKTATASATENPGTFTISASTAHRAITVGVQAGIPPIPAFTYSQAGGGLAVAFVNGTTYGSTYSWAFGDGTTSTSASPTKTYSAGGRYTVTLTATNAYGSASTSTVVTVIPVPDTPPARPDGLDVALELSANGGWHEFTCDVTQASWNWGASGNQGMLTTQEAGTLTFTAWDPDREWDPRNAVGSWYPLLDIGTSVRVKIGTAIVFTGRITGITHGLDRAHGVDFVTVSAEDTLATLGRYAADADGVGSYGAANTDVRITALANAAGWPAGSRDIASSPTPQALQAVTVNDQVWPQIVAAAQSDGGRVQVTQAGVLHFRERTTAWATSAIALTLGCDGNVDVEGMALAATADALINSLEVGRVGGSPSVLTDATSIAKYGTWTATKTDLLLSTVGAETSWGNFVLARQKTPMYGVGAVTFALGSTIATTVTTALMGDRWRVRDEHHGPMIDVTQRLLGLSYMVGPTRVLVTATLGEDYGLTSSLVDYAATWAAEAEWEVASAYGVLNVNGNSGALAVTDQVV
jgi:PKD repeat protein